jgi:glutamine phosphoribosylpyrophosphate amidotransferase
MEEADRNNKIIAMELISVTSMKGPLNFTCFLEYVYNSDNDSIKNKIPVMDNTPKISEELKKL